MTRRDVAMADDAVQRALESTISGSSTRWRNDQTGYSGIVKPLRSYRSATGPYCREYEEFVTLGGESERYRDTACRHTDGNWLPVPANES